MAQHFTDCFYRHTIIQCDGRCKCVPHPVKSKDFGNTAYICNFFQIRILFWLLNTGNRQPLFTTCGCSSYFWISCIAKGKVEGRKGHQFFVGE